MMNSLQYFEPYCNCNISQNSHISMFLPNLSALIQLYSAKDKIKRFNLILPSYMLTFVLCDYSQWLIQDVSVRTLGAGKKPHMYAGGWGTRRKIYCIYGENRALHHICPL